ncbi:MAG: LysM peptidoglycan-binding domain-containing protein [Sphingobacteriales bacterium]|nr:LysM peptidoglycan-binding domain-containing protein [Sphingobacteriales bacterium]
MKFLSLLVCLFIGANLYAQTDLVVKSDGNTGYLTHTVGPKENYYSIGRIYNISPRTYAPYNNLKLETPMSIGQVVRIPLVQQNYVLDNSGNATEAFVPLYYVVQEKEGLMKVGQHFGISADDLKKLNGIKGDGVNIGDKLVIGYLKVLKEQSPLAANAKVGKPIVKEASSKEQVASSKTQEVVKNEPKKEDKPVVKQPEVKQEEKPIAKTPEVKKEEKPVVKPTTSSQQPATNKEGVFMNEYFSQTNNGSNTQSSETMCGVFKSSSGWNNGKYYALMNGVERGTIVKIMVNGRTVYAKVLDAVPNVKENAGLNVLISNAAAAQLEINEQKFNVGVMWSK